jgi:hypothetical protein
VQNEQLFSLSSFPLKELWSQIKYASRRVFRGCIIFFRLHLSVGKTSSFGEQPKDTAIEALQSPQITNNIAALNNKRQNKSKRTRENWLYPVGYWRHFGGVTAQHLCGTLVPPTVLWNEVQNFKHISNCYETRNRI